MLLHRPISVITEIPGTELEYNPIQRKHLNESLHVQTVPQHSLAYQKRYQFTLTSFVVTTLAIVQAIKTNY